MNASDLNWESFLSTQEESLVKSPTRVWDFSNLDMQSQDEEAILKIASALRTRETILSLQLANCHLHSSDVKELAEAIRDNPNVIEELNFRSNRIGRKGGEALGGILSVSTTLTLLDLSTNRINDRAVEIIAKNLSGQNIKLKRLLLRGNRITYEGSQHLADALKENKTITELDLRYNDIGSEGTRYIAKSLEANSTLKILRLRHNCITDKGVEYLAKSLQENNSLLEVGLRHNYIGDQGAAKIAEMLEQRTSADTLKIGLRRNLITSEGAKRLASALKVKTGSSITLELCMNEIDDDGAKALFEVYDDRTSKFTLSMCTNPITDPEIQKKVHNLKEQKEEEQDEQYAYDYSKIKTDNIKELVRDIKKREISLQKIDIEGLKKPAIKHVKISTESLSNEDVNYLLNTLIKDEYLLDLEGIDLSYNRLTKKFFTENQKPLSELFQKRPSLNFIDICGNPCDLDEIFIDLDKFILEKIIWIPKKWLPTLEWSKVENPSKGQEQKIEAVYQAHMKYYNRPPICYEKDFPLMMDKAVHEEIEPIRDWKNFISQHSDNYKLKIMASKIKENRTRLEIGKILYNSKDKERDARRVFFFLTSEENKIEDDIKGEAYLYLGHIYRHAKGCHQDIVEAKRFYEKSLNLGFEDAKAALSETIFE